MGASSQRRLPFSDFSLTHNLALTHTQTELPSQTKQPPSISDLILAEAAAGGRQKKKKNQ